MKRRCAVVLLAVLLFVVWGSAQGYAAQARASEEIMSYYATISKKQSETIKHLFFNYMGLLTGRLMVICCHNSSPGIRCIFSLR